MKKAITKALLYAMTIVSLAAIIPLCANASTSNEQKIYSFLTQEMNLNSAAACGILANIESESDFNSKLVIRDSNGLQSGGLCQWNGGRFSRLKQYCSNNGYSYLSVEGQLNYLKYELSQKSYSYIYDFLKQVTNNADGAYDAAYYWCYYFEVPANKGTKAKQRGTDAVQDYWPDFGNKVPSKANLSFSKNDKTYDIDDGIKVKWTSSGKNTSYYELQVAQKNSNGKYNWDNAKTYTVSSSKKSATVPADSLDKGKYAIRVQAVNSTTGEYKNSNVIYCTVECSTHEFTTKVTKQATLESKGKQVSTCKQCGKKVTASIPVLTASQFEDKKMYKPSVNSTTSSRIRIKWESYPCADGYVIYRKSGKKWKKLASVPATTNNYLIKNLDDATEYNFRIKAYAEIDGKTYYTKASSTLKASTETLDPTLKANLKGNTCKLTWNKVSGADGYKIYVSTGKNSKSYKTVAIVDAKTSSYTIKNLKKGKTYNYVIKAFVNCNGDKVFSDASNIRTVKVK